MFVSGKVIFFNISFGIILLLLIIAALICLSLNMILLYDIIFIVNVLQFLLLLLSFFFQAIIPMSSSANVGHAVQLFSECDNEGSLYPSSNTVTLV